MPANPQRRRASTHPIFFLTTADFVPLKTCVTSVTSPTDAPRPRSSSLISSSRTCLNASCSTIVSIRSSSCTPLTSTLAPPAIEMLTSCLIVPIPRFTNPVERRIMPICSAASLACAGEIMSGAVPISTNGMPRRSSENTTAPSCSSTLWQASSSRQSTSTPTLPCDVSKCPPVATSDVRWNPDVFEPSITSLRMIWISSTGCIFSSLAVVSVISIASSFNSRGGSSSFSTRQVLGYALYINLRITFASSSAA